MKLTPVEKLVMDKLAEGPCGSGEMEKHTGLPRMANHELIKSMREKGLLVIKYVNGSKQRMIIKVESNPLDAYLLRNVKLPDVPGRVIRLFHDDFEGIKSDPPRKRYPTIQSSWSTISMVDW